MHRNFLLLVKYVAKHFLDYLLPNSCINCNNFLQDEHSFCHECWKKIDFITNIACNICGSPFDLDLEDLVSSCASCFKTKPYYDSAKALMRYDNAIAKKIIHNFKYNDKTWLSKSFASLLCNNYAQWINNCDYIIAVPMYKFKRLWRGYNQAHILAEDVSGNLKITNLVNCLVKTKWTSSQTTLSKNKRLLNLEGSFAIINPDVIYNKNILLVDDVITTGSTINLCSKLLKKAGAKTVKVAAIAIA